MRYVHILIHQHADTRRIAGVFSSGEKLHEFVRKAYPDYVRNEYGDYKKKHGVGPDAYLFVYERCLNRGIVF